MFLCRILLVVLLSGLSVPESVSLAAEILDAALSRSARHTSQSLPISELPAPCDGDEAEAGVEQENDDAGTLAYRVELQPLWSPTRPSNIRTCYATARELRDALHRLRI